MIDWTPNIISDIAQRRCVLFLGSGVSANSENAAHERPKTWVDILYEGLEHLSAQISTKQKNIIKKNIKTNDLLMACELIKKYLGDDDYKDLLKREFYEKHFLPAQIHKDIEQLDSRFVITPNFDQIYENYVHTIPGNDTIVVNYTANNIVDLLRTANRLIIKSHGDINSADEIIFTKADYAEARNKHAQFYAVMDALLLTHTFIFIGAGFNDPDIRLLLEDYTYRNKYKRKHIFITPKDSMSPEEFEIMGKTLSLKFFMYDSKDGHKELTESIADLKQKVEDYRTTH